MSSEIKNCQNCTKDFTIEPDDFLFYEKIKVPPPTFCPHCRFSRRMIWRNERSLYKRKCDMCQKHIISMYDGKVSFPVYCPECWRSDKWEANEYGQNYDFSKPFFSQFEELFNKVPRQATLQYGKCIDCDYTNYVKDAKNVYLSYSALDCEDVYYSGNVDHSRGIIDSYNVVESEILYENIGSKKNYDCKYSYWSPNCIDCNFVVDCINCSNCFGCVNLRNKSYCIWNKQYSKEEYIEILKDFNLGSYKFVQKTFSEFMGFSLQFPKKYLRIINCVDSVGDEIRDCNNVQNLFKGQGNENVKFGYRVTNARDSMDVCHSWAELAYEHAMGGSENGFNVKFVINGAVAENEVEFVDSCQSCSNVFACIGINNKQYHIFNKQYTKEEYFEMVEKIKKHMDDMPYVDAKGNIYKYGEFFPYELCPFGYNEAVINDHFPLTKEEIIERGYKYKEKIDNKYTITLKANDIPDDIKDVDDSMLNEVIECEVSGKAFKITPFELQFYKRMNIPIPRLHPDERYKRRLALRNPMILYHRSCMNKGCTNSFETTYAPDRPEIVYCKECYQREVY
ncbi:MAG: hypothetical protein WCW04_02920 [Candidatus Paceibacterota bacterium]